MGISGSYGSDLPELISLPSGAQIIGTKDDILFRADPSLLGGTVVDDNLTSTSTTNALSANQGKVLKDTIDGLGSGVIVVDNLTTQSTTNALSANQGYLLSQNIANKAGLASPAFTGIPTAPTAIANTNSTQVATTAYADAAANSAKTYAEGLVVGLLDDRGNYNPTVTSNYPIAANNGSGAAGAIKKGDLWTVSVDGTIGGIAVTVGDIVRALVDAPAQTASNWATTQNNIIYVPENAANKSTSNTLGTSDTLYPTQKAVKEYVDNNALTNASTRYSVNAQTGTTYTVVAGDVTSTGRGIVKCTNAAAITVTIPTPTTLGVTTGDSVNIRQGGAGNVTISGALEGNGVFTAQHETKTLIAQAANTWLVVGG